MLHACETVRRDNIADPVKKDNGVQIIFQTKRALELPALHVNARSTTLAEDADRAKLNEPFSEATRSFPSVWQGAICWPTKKRKGILAAPIVLGEGEE